MNFWYCLGHFVQKYEAVIIAVSTAAAAFAAIVSIVLAYWTTKNQNKHNRTSIKPLCSFSIADYEDKIFVKIKNNGLGPLVVKSLCFEKNNEIISHGNLVELLPDLPDGKYWDTYSRITESQVIAAQNEVTMLCLLIDDDLFPYSNDVRRILGNITLNCTYTDLYGIERYAEKKNLEWFLRRWPIN